MTYRDAVEGAGGSFAAWDAATSQPRVETMTVLIRVSRDLLGVLGTRTEDGARLSFDLGGRRATASTFTPDIPGAAAYAVEDVYEPTITATDDGAHLCHCPDRACHPA